MKRFWIKLPQAGREHLSPGATVELTGPEHHHLKNVCRLTPEADVILIDGRGSLARAKLKRCDRHLSLLLVTELESAEPPEHRWTLALALIRPKLLELAIEKGIELGIDRFVLFAADYSEGKPPSNERLETIATGALKQSGRLFLPEIMIADHLEFPDEPLFFGSLEPSAQPLQQLPQQATFFIGPEGGFSKKELRQLERATPVYLGPHILRAETAAIAMASQVAALSA